MIVCTSFLLSEIGRVLEDPFTTCWNGLPLTALSHGIEIDVRHRLGDRDLDPVPGPVNDILM